MGVDKTHLVFESLGHTSDHVLHVTAACANGGKGLALAEMAIYSELLLALFLEEEHVNRKMLEIAGEGACREREREYRIIVSSSISLGYL